MYNIYRFILPLLTLVRGETSKYLETSSSRVFKRICFLELETLPITVGGRTTPRGLDWPNRGEDRRSIEMRIMSRCFTWFTNWLVLGEPYIYHLELIEVNNKFPKV